MADDYDPAFYDALADDYHLIYGDWWRSATRHGEVISAMLGRAGVRPPADVLDCTCGIGTQALPLAAKGFRVVGSDLSDGSIRRARREAEARGIDIELHALDVRTLPTSLAGRTFDAVIAADNSLPHLPTEHALREAVIAIYTRLRPGGVFLASIRDYDRLVRDNTQGVAPVVHTGEGGRRIVGQAWEWSPDLRSLTISLFLLTEGAPGWGAAVHTTTYRAVRRAELTAALTAAGFTEIGWHEPADSGFYQPIVLARALALARS